MSESGINRRHFLSALQQPRLRRHYVHQGQRKDHFRTGENLGSEVRRAKTAVLADDTVTNDDKGLFGLDKKQVSSVALIPGLKVDVHATSDGQRRVIHA